MKRGQNTMGLRFGLTENWQYTNIASSRDYYYNWKCENIANNYLELIWTRSKLLLKNLYISELKTIINSNTYQLNIFFYEYWYGYEFAHLACTWQKAWLANYNNQKINKKSSVSKYMRTYTGQSPLIKTIYFDQLTKTINLTKLFTILLTHYKFKNLNKWWKQDNCTSMFDFENLLKWRYYTNYYKKQRTFQFLLNLLKKTLKIKKNLYVNLCLIPTSKLNSKIIIKYLTIMMGELRNFALIIRTLNEFFVNYSHTFIATDTLYKGRFLRRARAANIRILTTKSVGKSNLSKPAKFEQTTVYTKYGVAGIRLYIHVYQRNRINFKKWLG